MKKYKKLIADMAINIISFGIPIVILQFIVLPFFAASIDPDGYGLLLTLTALVSIVSEMAVGTLANVRILENENYVNKGIIGIFKTLFYILLTFSTVIVFFASKLIFGASYIDTFYLVGYYILLSIRIYYLAGFRIENKYTSVMINNIIVSIGYIAGVVIFGFINIWQIVFILPASLAVVHLYATTKLYKERAIFDPELGKLAKQNTSLMFSYVIGSGMSYIDRIYLYPILGGQAVSTYQVSTLMGKLFSLIGAPINMVILSYTAKMKIVSRKIKVYIVIVTSVFGFIYSIIAIAIAPFIIKLIYPQYFEAASEFIPVVTIAITIFNISTILRIISMKTTGHYTILAIELIYASIYIGSASILLWKFGLMGFCFATLFAAIIRYILFVFVNISNFKVEDIFKKVPVK